MKEFSVKAMGYVRSPLRTRDEAPKQGEEGSPLATLVFDASVRDALSSIHVGDKLLLFTWLDRADRSVMRVHPRDNHMLPLHGVFSTRSPDRPNPIGLHRVTIVSIRGGLEFDVHHLEALDQTPIIDLKAVLDGFTE